MSSSESWRGWRMARLYGPQVCRLDRAARIAWAAARIAALETLMRQDQDAHERTCVACQSGTDVFRCLESLQYDPRLHEVARWRDVISAEQRDQEYAERARWHQVEYRDHVDGFCSYWQNLRHRLFESVGHRCEGCTQYAALEAHHRHYDTLGFEELDDLQALCRKCHGRGAHAMKVPFAGGSRGNDCEPKHSHCRSMIAPNR